MGLQCELSDIVEPDFGLLDHLLSVEMLTRTDYDHIRCLRTVYRRNAAILDLITSADRCAKFLQALQRTDQQHVVNFVIQNGGTITTILHYTNVEVSYMIVISK